MTPLIERQRSEVSSIVAVRTAIIATVCIHLVLRGVIEAPQSSGVIAVR